MKHRTLYDSTALVTGASSGIGREIAIELARRGARALILVARRTDRLDSLRDRLYEINPALHVECQPADLSESGQVDRLIGWIEDSGLPLDLLVNNAGLGDFGFFAESDPGKCQRMIDVNVAALVRLTRGVLPGMTKRGGGTILNVSSTASYVPVPKMAVYAATKAFVTSFGEALRAELDGTGVTVTTLCPGPVDTEFHSVARRGETGSFFQSPEWFRVPSVQVAIEALDAVEDARPRVVPGLAVCLAMTTLSLVPVFFLRGVLRRIARGG